MNKSRLEAFSDGVIAILITIMVLELRVPEGPDWGALHHIVPKISVYLLSFVFLGIYWNNHHHMLHAATRISGRVLWPNLHLLFWLSLTPWVTAWIGDFHDEALPTAAYGAVMLCAAFAYLILQTTLVRTPGNERLAEALGSDTKGKLSLALYALAIPLAFVHPRISDVVYVIVALIWLVPDTRIESGVQR